MARPILSVTYLVLLGFGSVPAYSVSSITRLLQCPAPLVGCESTNASPQSAELPHQRCNGRNESKPDEFAEVTLFLFGSGLALFVALLGWSDQIRSINQDTRDIQKKFIETSGIGKEDFLAIVKSDSPDKQLDGLIRAMASGKPKTATQADVLQTFRMWNREWSRLEELSAWKYRLAVALTYSLFAAGIITLFVNPNAEASLYLFRVRALLLILLVPMAGILAILTIIVLANQKEAYFRGLLNSLSEKV